jgi:predicted GNAT family acetyltransferase
MSVLDEIDLEIKSENEAIKPDVVNNSGGVQGSEKIQPEILKTIDSEIESEKNQVPFAGKKVEEFDNSDYEILSSLSPEKLFEVSNIRKDIPLNDDQLRSVYDFHKAKAITDDNYGTPSSIREFMDYTNRLVEPIGKVGTEVAHTVWSAAKGAGKLAYRTADYVTTPDMDIPEYRKYYTPEQQAEFRKSRAEKRKAVEEAWQSAGEPIVGMPEGLTWLGTKLGAGGFDWYDRASEALGLQDHETSFQHFKARRAIDSAQAQYFMEHPSAYGRMMNLPIVKGGLEAIIKSQMPSVNEWMASHPDITKEQAQAQLDALAKNHVEKQIMESEESIAETDPDIATFTTFAAPEGLGMGTMGALGMGLRVAGEITPKITQGLKYLGKTDAEINAMNEAAQRLMKEQQAEKVAERMEPSLLEKAAGKTAAAIDWTTAFGKGLTEKIPSGIRPYVPYVAAGGVGGIYGHQEGRSVIGDVIQGVAIAGLLKSPALVRDIEQARRISAGGTKGTFETMAGFPNVSEGAAKVIRFGGKNVDRLLDNTVEYAKAGIHGTALAVATGALESADSDTMEKLVSEGLVYTLGGHAFQRIKGQFTGFDPILERRKRAQQDVDNLKTYSDLSPETQQTLNDLTNWSNVVESQQKKADDARIAYLDAVERGSKDASKLENEWRAQTKGLSSVMRANVQTRNEYGRLFVDQLSRNNQLVNGSLRAGQNNVGTHILTTQQIFDKFKKDPANAGVSDADIMEAAQQAGFYSLPEGAIEYKAGMGMEAPKKDMVFDRTKPSVVINADHLKARMNIFGESATQALNHEIGHHVGNIPEFREANKDAEALLFSQEIRDPSGAVVSTTSGRYSPKDLVEMYEKNYMSGKTPEQIEQLSKLAGLWDFSRGSLDENAVASYMRDEIIADLNAGTISRHLGKDLDSGTQHLMDVASIKTKKNLLDRAIQKFAGLGGKGSAISPLTGAEFSPEVLAANRQAMRALQSLQGEVSPAVKAPDAPKISRAEMMKNKALMERYGKYSGLFKTKVQAQIFDGNGKPVGAPIDIANPNAAEGSWQNREGTVRQLKGYGQRPDEVAGIDIPEGGSLVVGRQIVTQADGKTPVLLEAKEAKKLQKARTAVIRDALNTPDEGAPNRFEPTGDPDGTWRGTLTPLQIEAIKNLPEGIVPKSIKENIFNINDLIVRGDGSRMLVDYAAVMNDNGRYTPYSAKIYDVVPIGMHLSKDGHFLVTTISVGRMFDKLNKWSERMPARLAPWNGSKDAFFKEFTEKYLQNWQNGLAGETGLAGTPAEAIAKKNIFNDFLNLATKDTAPLNPDRTKMPRRKGDVRGKDIDRTIMSMRLDHMAELIDNDGAPKVPVSYQKAKFNLMPAEEPVPVAPQEERRPSAIDLGITAAHSKESKPFGISYVATQAQAPTPKSDLFFMPASAEIREKGSKQHLEFWNRELENSGIKDKPTTMEALDQWIYNKIGERYKPTRYIEGGGYQALFPKPDANKIKSYYEKVVRNATPAQAVNFPENWRRVRNMSEDEFNNFFSQDRVNEITKSRVETLSKSADYLLGEMRKPRPKADIKDELDFQSELLSKLLKTQKEYRDENKQDEYLNQQIQRQEGLVSHLEREYNGEVGTGYTPSEVAAILDQQAKIRVRTAKDEDGNIVPFKQKITNGNEVVPNEVSGATASRIAEYMRQGIGSEDAYAKGVYDEIQARAKERGTYTGWKKYDQSDNMGEAEKLNADVAGTNWCTGGAVSTAHQHLSGGDFYVYFDEGEPQVAIRTDGGQIAEVRGRGEGQNITTAKYDQAAEEFIRSEEGPEGGASYLHDRNFRKLAVQLMETGKLPDEAYRYYDQTGRFTEPKPKMSYKSDFEPEYIEPFKGVELGEIIDAEGNLKTSLRYNDLDTNNQKYKSVAGDITGKEFADYFLEMPNLERVGGGIIVGNAKSLILPNLKECDYIFAKGAKKVSLENLTKCNAIQIPNADALVAPKLTKVERVIDVQDAVVVDLKNLKQAGTLKLGGASSIQKSINLTSLEKVDGAEIQVRSGDTISLPKLQEAGSLSLHVGPDGTINLPNLIVSERIFSGAKEVNLPKLTITTHLEPYGREMREWETRVNFNNIQVLNAPPDVFSKVATHGFIENFTYTDSLTGRTYKTKSRADFGDLAYTFQAIKGGDKKVVSVSGSPTPEEVLSFYEVETQATRDRKAKEPEKIVAATYTDPELMFTTEGETHLLANPNAPAEQVDRETSAYGFKTNKGRNVSREEAFTIAREAGQLKPIKTTQQDYNAYRGVLHSDMVDYGKGDIAFMPKVAVVPERFTGTGEEEARRGKYVEPPKFFGKFNVSQYEKGGKFFDAETGEDITDRSYENASISVEGGKPSLVANNEAEGIGTGPIFRSNLFKQKAGWKWISENPPETSTIVSVEGQGKHIYTLRADFQNGVKMARYPDKTSEPRLRPTGRGELVTGQEIGRIDIRGKEHPVYDAVTIGEKPANDLSFIPAQGESKPVPTQEQLDEMKARLPKYTIKTEDYAGLKKILIYSPERNREVGFAYVKKDKKDKTNLNVFETNVDFSFRNRGFGQSLYREIAKYAQSVGATTFSGNPVTPEAMKRREQLFETEKPETADVMGTDYAYATSKVPSDIAFMPYSPELPKTEDGKVDWEGFKTRTQETAKPLAGLRFMPSKPVAKNEELPDFETTIIRGVTPIKGFKWDKATNVEIDIGDGRKMSFSFDPEYLEVPQFKDIIEELKGEAVILLEADRQRATGGDMGGPLHPFLKSNQVTITGPDGIEYKAVWANMTSTFVSGAKNRLADHGAKYAVVHLMDSIAHKSNKRTARTLDKLMRESNLNEFQKEIISLSMQAGIIAGKKAALSAGITALNRALKDSSLTKEQITKINNIIKERIKQRDALTPTGVYGDIYKKVSNIKTAQSNLNTGRWKQSSLDNAVENLKQFTKTKEYKELLKKNKSLYISDNIGETFNDRGSAIGSILSFKFDKFDPSRVMRESSDFREGENLDIVTAVELSQNPDMFALYFGKDPKEEAAMSPAERKARDEMRANPNFVEHEAYDWVMLGPKDGNNFLVKKPVKPEQIFKNYRKVHPKKSVKEGSDESVAGAMRKYAGIKLIVDEDAVKIPETTKKKK